MMKKPFLLGKNTRGDENKLVAAVEPTVEEKPAASTEHNDVNPNPTGNELGKRKVLIPPTLSTPDDAKISVTESFEIARDHLSPTSDLPAMPITKLTSAREELRANHSEREPTQEDAVSDVMPSSPVDANVQLSSTESSLTHSRVATATSANDIKLQPAQSYSPNTTFIHNPLLQASPSFRHEQAPNVGLLQNLTPQSYSPPQYGGANLYLTHRQQHHGMQNIPFLHNLAPQLYSAPQYCGANLYTSSISQLPTGNRQFLCNLPPHENSPFHYSEANTRFRYSQYDFSPQQGYYPNIEHLHNVPTSPHASYPKADTNYSHHLTVDADQEVKINEPSTKPLLTCTTTRGHGVGGFKYQTLPDSIPESLRLLRIEHPTAVSSADDIFCAITVAQPWAHGLLYECLSYAWGDSATTGHIYLRSAEQGSEYRKVSTRINLVGALRQLKRTHTMKWLWIDAICIDQTNLKERASQVAMMKEIYSNASGVVIWLGDSSPDLSAAITTITTIANHFQMDTNLVVDSIIGSEGLRLSSENIGLLRSYHSIFDTGTTLSASYSSVGRIFALPWFRRVWVLQEALAHTNVSVRLGEYTLPWGSVILAALWSSAFTRNLTAMSASENREEGIIHHGYLPELWLGLLHTRMPRGLTILELVSRGRDFEASDPRDRVFALIGLANDIGSLQIRASGLRPDYTKSKVEVYTAFARDLILMTGNLDVLSLVNTFVSRTQSHRSVSWMPDLDVPVATIRGFGFPTKYDASFSTKVKADLIRLQPHSPYTLALSGVCIDKVFVTESIMTCSRNLKVYLSYDTEAVMELWKTQIQRKNPNISELHLLKSYIELLTATGFVMPTKFPTHPLGIVVPSRGVPSVIADFAAYWTRLEPDFSSFRKDSQPYLRAQAKVGDADHFGVLAGKACHERKFFVTIKGRIGLCPRNAQLGDEIVVLYGGSVPYVLRARENGQWGFVGECYVDGLMFGEAEKLEKEERVFHLA